MATGINNSRYRDFLLVLFKYKYKILIIFIIISVSITVISILIPKTYQANSTVLIKFGREYIYRPEVGEQSPLINSTPEEIINSEIQILTSRDNIERVITTITVPKLYSHLYIIYPRTVTPLEAARKKFEKNLSVEKVRKSNVIRISFQHKDPKIAAEVVNLLVDFFKEKHLQVFSDQKTGFLESQLASYEGQLADSEDRLQTFRQENGVFAFERQIELLLNQRMELKDSLAENDRSLGGLLEKLVSLRTQLSEYSSNPDLHTETARDKIVVDGESRLLALRVEELSLLEGYSEQSRKVQDVRKKIQLVEAFLERQEAVISRKVKSGNPVYQEVKMDIIKTEAESRSLVEKSQTIKKQLENIKQELQLLDLKNKELRELKQEIAVNQKNYQLYRGKVEDTRISADLNQQKIANFSIIQTALVPSRPVKPRLGLNMAVGAFFGLLSGFGFAFIREYLGQTFSTPDSVEKRLGVPVLATISFAGDKEKRGCG